MKETLEMAQSLQQGFNLWLEFKLSHCTDLRLRAVHIKHSQFIFHQLHSHSRQRGVLLQLTDGTLDVLHHHMSITTHIQIKASACGGPVKV